MKKFKGSIHNHKSKQKQDAASKTKEISLLNKPASNNIPPLFDAILNGTHAQVESLLTQNADVNMKAAGSNKTPLHAAVDLRDSKMVSLLLEKKAEIEASTTSGFTPLHVAATKNKSDIIKLLVEKKASVESQGPTHLTPLHEAAAMGHEKAILTLLELKADLNARETRYNLSPANLAQQNNKLAASKLLIQGLNYEQLFIQTINLLVHNYTNQRVKNSLGGKFFEDLMNQLIPIKTGDEAFLCLQKNLKSEKFKSIKDQLEVEKQTFIVLMKKYNENKLAAASEASTANTDNTAKSTKNA